MKVLFIGGTGLISTSIANQLCEQGHEVVLYNRGKTKSRVTGDCKVIEGDRKNTEEFEKQFADENYDVVVDMVAFTPEDTQSAIRAFKGRTQQFIHCSTVCVYSGPVEQLPTTETEPYHSIGNYGKNKIRCEELLWEANSDELPVTIMRPSHSYGEGGDIIRCFGSNASFIDRLRTGKPVIIPGDGTNLWASCHVDDVARGFIGVMQNSKCIGEAYNITGDEWMTWNTYHEQVAEVAGGQLEAIHIPTETLQEVAPDLSGSSAEILSWPSIFDNSKIKRDTNYDGQTINFREGVKRTLQWLEANDRLKESENGDSDNYEDELIASWRTHTAALPRHKK